MTSKMKTNSSYNKVYSSNLIKVSNKQKKEQNSLTNQLLQNSTKLTLVCSNNLMITKMD